jgi:Zn-dependent protease with chaperone function
MSLAPCLLVYSFAVVVLAPGLLVRLTHAGSAPRLGILAWLAAIVSVLASWSVAVVAMGAELIRDRTHPGHAVTASCVGLLRAAAAGQHGVPIQLGLFLLIALITSAMLVLSVRLVRSMWRARTATQQHARMAQLAGQRNVRLQVDGLDARVLDTPQPAVYCVASRPRMIVVTSAALTALDPPRLRAVLAHERAHLAGHHHLVVAFTRALAKALPRVRLFTLGATEVARLLEMAADDTAARAHGRPTVLDALLALCAAGAGAPMPREALGATGLAVLTRVERLLEPAPTIRQIKTGLLLGAAATVLVTGPVLVGLLTAAGLALCGPMG